VWQTFLALAAIYFVFMMGGAFAYRVPASSRGASSDKRATAGKPMDESVHYHDAIKTRQFWLIWAVLCLNVSAGIGVIGMASPMLQEIFGASAAVAAGFTGLISLFNIGGRFFWASLSDHIGRKATYATFFLLGIGLYASAPSLARAGSQAAFVLAVCVIVSMYGGGFATIPAYLADTFGTQYVGAIHGRLLTAWSTAGIIGPVLVNYIREAELAAGVPRQQAYDVTLYILAGLLMLGFFTNAMIKPLAERHFAPRTQAAPGSRLPNPGPLGLRAAFAWTAVGVPLIWGTWVTLTQAFVLFSGGR
jgi:nitrate/nitrite transporter NarK